MVTNIRKRNTIISQGCWWWWSKRNDSLQCHWVQLHYDWATLRWQP